MIFVKISGKAGIVFAVLSLIGMGVTMYLTAKKAPEAVEAMNQARDEKRKATGDENAELTPMESFKAQAPCYVPAACSAMITTVTIVGSQFLPQKTISDLEKWKYTYQDISSKLHGPKAQKIMDQMASQKITQGTDGMRKETFVIQHGHDSIIFESTLLDVFEAEYDTNRLFTGLGEVTFNEMLHFFHQEPVEQGDEFGWNTYLGEAWYGYSWIDFYHRRGMLDGKPVTFIDMPFECHSLNEDDEAYTNTFGSEIVNHGIEGTA